MSNGQIPARESTEAQVAGGEFAAKTNAPRGVREKSIKSLSLRAAVVARDTASLADVIRLMRERASECVIIQREEQIAGVFTECDFLTKVAGLDVDRDRPALDFASRAGAAIFSSAATLGDAISSISDGCCRNIIVTENKTIMGIISDLDLITYLAESYPKETMNLPPVPNQIMDTQEGG